MNKPNAGLTAILAAALWLAAPEAPAQEYTLPPAPNSGADPAFSAENGPCFYNPYRWSSRTLLNNTYLGAEIQSMMDPASSGDIRLNGCSDTYGLTSASFLGVWAYMFADGQADVLRAPYVPRWKVEAIKKASLEYEARKAAGHAPVPVLGEGYGSGDLQARTVHFVVAPERKPSMYNGIPIIERDRSWERFETIDGRRVWQDRPVVPLQRQGARASYEYERARSAGDPSVVDGKRFDRPPRAASGSPSSGRRVGATSSPAPRSSGLSSPRSSPTPRATPTTSGRAPRSGKVEQ